MATKPLQSIKFPGLSDTYTIPQVDATLTTTGAAADAKVTGDAINQLTTNLEGGHALGLTASAADQLLSDNGVTDNIPYTVRRTGGGVEVGTSAKDKLVGGTICWNQLIPNGNFADTSGWVWSTGTMASVTASNNTLSFTSNSSSNMDLPLAYMTNFYADRKLIFFIDAKCSSATRMRLRFPTLEDGQTADIPANTWTRVVVTTTTTSSSTLGQFRIQMDGKLNATYELKNIMCFDVTMMFGPTIAATITSSSIKAMFPNDYYAYDAGTMRSVNVSAHKTTGFNLWDGEWENGTINTSTGELIQSANYVRSKNLMPCVPNASYYFNCTKQGCSSLWARVFFYDENMKYISYTYPYSPTSTDNANYRNPFTSPAAARYMRFQLYSTYGTVGGDDICFSFSGARNGEYESPKSMTYPLDSSLTLLGIPQLDTNNRIYFDGDTYESNGKVTRKYVQQTFDGSQTWYDYTNVGANTAGAQIGLGTYAAGGRQKIFTNFGIPTQETPATSTSYGITQVADTLFITFPTSMFASYTAWQTYLTSHPLTIVREILYPTTSTTTPYAEIQVVDPDGIEEYIDAGTTAATPTRDVAIPVGHETFYPQDLKKELDKISSAGDYNAFDGVLFNGYWNSSGVLTSYVGDVCNAKKISCPENANIVIEATADIENPQCYVGYFSDTTRIRNDTTYGLRYKGTSPAGTKYICFCFEKSGTTKANYSSVYVGINNRIDEIQDNLETTTALSNRITGTITIPPFNTQIIQGSFNSNGAWVASNARIRVSEMLQVHQGEKIKFTPGTATARMLIGWFAADKSYISDSVWYISETTIPITSDGYIIILFSKDAAGSDILPSEYDAITELIPEWYMSAEKTEEINEAFSAGISWIGNGYIQNDGTIYTQGNFSYSEYIPTDGNIWISGNMYYVPSGCYYIGCYNANKTFISGLLEGDGAQTPIDQQLTLPSGTKYIRICDYSSQTSTVKLYVYNNLNDLKNQISGLPTVFDLSTTSTVSRQFKYNFHAGNQYTITNNTTIDITFQTRETKTGSAIQDIGSIITGQSKSFDCTTDAYWFNSWCPNVGNISILETNSRLISLKNDIKDDINIVQSRTESLEALTPFSMKDTLDFTLGKAWSGSVNQTASLTDNNNRLSNITPIKLNAGRYSLKINSGYRLSYRTLNSSNVVLADSGWLTVSNSFIADGTKYYAFTGGKANDASTSKLEFESNVEVIYTSEMVDYIEYLGNQSAINGIPNNVGMVNAPHSQIYDALSKGVTVTITGKNKFKLNGTATAGFNLALNYDASVPAPLLPITFNPVYYLNKRSDGVKEATDCYMHMNYFNDQDTVVGTNEKLYLFNQIAKYVYTSAAKKFSSYLHVNEGAVFDNVEFEFNTLSDYPLSDQISKATSGLPTVFTLSATSSSSRQFEYDFHVGNRYTIINNTTASISFQTRETKTGSAIQDVGTIAAGQSKSFDCTTEAYWFNSWSPDIGNITLFEKTPVIASIEASSINGIRSNKAETLITYNGRVMIDVASRTVAWTDSLYIILPNGRITIPGATAAAQLTGNASYNSNTNTVTITLAYEYALVYSVSEETLKIVYYPNIANDDVILFSEYYGNDYGLLWDKYWRDQYIDQQSSGILTATNIFNAEPYTGTYDWQTPVVTYGALFKGVSNVESFAFFTDPHIMGFADSNRNEIALANYFKRIQKTYNATPCSFLICGGDLLNNSTTMDEACYRLGYIKGIFEHLLDGCKLVLGNHDTNYQGKLNSESENYTGRLTDSTIASILYRDTNTKKAYYSFDGANSKCYVLDTGIEHSDMLSYDWEQIAWLAGKLAEDDPTHAIIFMHIIINNNQVQTNASNFGTLVQAYNAHTTVTLNGVAYNFTSCTGKVELWVAGHTHADSTGTLGGIPYVITATLSTEVPLIDLMLVDYDNHVLKTVRAGGTGGERTISLST